MEVQVEEETRTRGEGDTEGVILVSERLIWGLLWFVKVGGGVENGEVDEGMHGDGDMTETMKGQVGVVSEGGGGQRM